MSSILQYVRNNRLLILGLVVCPAGVYGGIKMKEWRTQKKIDDIQREVIVAEKKTAMDNAQAVVTDVRLELQGLRAARSSLLREKALLEQELDSIYLKLERLDERDKKNEIINNAKKE
ncbi:hypothetical protein J3B02_005056 [Coemansia erecta]|uniref:Uncharacterized protein n=1 Tax=Coemansia asiatica TaxID=1052880 RepID=A0A9W8CLQ3_9FUNG|nr:hypothetical protein LPJ64_001657 [Coemansia asiatica]KAJ2844141.1 hypothetical protein J3B02_005056 [Coemansia erecta]